MSINFWTSGRKLSLVLIALTWAGVMAWQVAKAITPKPELGFSLPSAPRDFRYTFQEKGQPGGGLLYSYTPDPATGQAVVSLQGKVRLAGSGYSLDFAARLNNAGNLIALTFIIKSNQEGFPLTGIFDRGILRISSPHPPSLPSVPLPPTVGIFLLSPLEAIASELPKNINIPIPGISEEINLLFSEDGTLAGANFPGELIIRRLDRSSLSEPTIIAN